MSPKLLRPVVDVEFRPDARFDEELCGSSSFRAASISEFNVEDRPRPFPPLADAVECADVVEFLRKRRGGLIALGDDSLTEDWVGDGNGETRSPSGVTGSIEGRPSSFETGDCRPLVGMSDPGGGSLTGRGNSGPRLLFKRSILNFFFG